MFNPNPNPNTIFTKMSKQLMDQLINVIAYSKAESSSQLDMAPARNSVHFAGAAGTGADGESIYSNQSFKRSSYYSALSMRDSLESDHDVDGIECCDCFAKFETGQQLAMHISVSGHMDRDYVHESQEEMVGPFFQDQEDHESEMAFGRPSQLEDLEGRFRKQKSVVGLFVCNDCGGAFESQYVLMQHQQDIHVSIASSFDEERHRVAFLINNGLI